MSYDHVQRTAERVGLAEGTLEGALKAQRARCKMGDHALGLRHYLPPEWAEALAIALGYQVDLPCRGEKVAEDGSMAVVQQTHAPERWTASLTSRYCGACSLERRRLTLMRWNIPTDEEGVTKLIEESYNNEQRPPDEKLETEWDV